VDEELVAVHEIPLERRTLHGHFSRDLEPVLTIDPGDTIRTSCLNAGWRLSPHGEFEGRDTELDAGHALIGPIEVRGAREGQALAVRIDTVRVGPWGVTLAYDDERLGIEGAGEHVVFWDLDADAGIGRDRSGHTVELRPFAGVLGMPPVAPGVHSTSPPRPQGGNIDCAELVAGTTLFLPIPVDGALFSAGDGHARQGDGEVSGTAIECPLDVLELTLDLRGDLELDWPMAWTPEAWIAFGFDADLDEAATKATSGMLDLIQREHGLGRPDALALASVVVDLRVTQVVNGIKGVHAVLRHDAIRFEG
jgi:acetamidase/formamidase